MPYANEWGMNMAKKKYNVLLEEECAAADDELEDEILNDEDD